MLPFERERHSSCRGVPFPRGKWRLGTHALAIQAKELQVVLGISTLLMAVPVWLAATHQAVAMLLLTSVLYLQHSLRRA